MTDEEQVARFHATRAREAIAASGGLVNLSGIAQRFAVSKSSAQAWTKKAGFPAPVYVGGQETLWFVAEVEAWRA